MSRKILSDDEIRLLLLNNNDAGEGSEEELIPCNDSEVEHNVIHDDSDTSASSGADSETDRNNKHLDNITSRYGAKLSNVPHNLLFQAPIFQIFFLTMY